MYVTDVTGPRRLFVYVAAALMLAMTILRVAIDALTLAHIRNVAILKCSVRLGLYSTSFLFALIFHVECQCIAPWQWQCGVMAVFLSWLNLIIHLSKFPFAGIYVIMLIRVFYTFLKVVLLSLLLAITFGLTFFMAFHEPSILVGLFLRDNILVS